MREIKFRAWNKERKMLCTQGLQFTYEEPYGIYDVYSPNEDEMEEYVVMQYTGLKDKNSKDIYEGDVVKYVSILWREGEPIYVRGDMKPDYFSGEYHENKGTVTFVGIADFDIEHAKYDLLGYYYDENGKNKEFNGREKMFLGYGLSASSLKQIEIIGNIYESPELLK